MLRDRWLGLGLVVLASVGFGAQGILSQYAYAGGADVPTLLALRFGVGTLVVWALLLAMPRARRPLLRYPPRALLGFGLLGALFVTNALFYYLSLTRLPVGTAAVLVFVFPALVVLWSVLFFGERLTALKTGALALALAGVVLTIDPAAALAVGAGISWLGVLWALGSAFSNSWYVVLAGLIGRGRPSLAVALYSLPVTAVFFGGYLLLAGGSYGMDAVAWASCLGIGALTGLSIFLYLIGLARIGASRASIVATSEPATALLLGALLLAEPLTPVKLFGGACVAAAVVLLSLPNRADRPAASPEHDARE